MNAYTAIFVFSCGAGLALIDYLTGNKGSTDDLVFAACTLVLSVVLAINYLLVDKLLNYKAKIRGLQSLLKVKHTR